MEVENGHSSLTYAQINEVPNQHPKESARKRRVLVINESIEVNLDTESEDETSNVFQKSEKIENDTNENSETEGIFNSLDESKLIICEEEIFSDIEDKQIGQIDISRSPTSFQVGIPNFIVKPAPLISYRKIAPKKCLEDTSVVKEEVWRINPPKKKKTYKRKKNESKISKLKVPKLKKKSEAGLAKVPNELGLDENFKELEKNYQIEIVSYEKDLKNSINEVRNETVPSKYFGSEYHEQEISLLDNSLCMEYTSVQNEDFIKLGESLLPCPFCNYKSPKPVLIKRHLVSHHTKVPRCNSCKLYIPPKQLFSHIAKHDKKDIRCPLCEVTSKSIHILKNHLLLKHSKFYDTCNFCEFKVIHKKNFKDRMKELHSHVQSCHSKIDESEFKCQTCNFSTQSNLEMKSHIYLAHYQIQRSVFHCLDCTVSVDGLADFLSHLTTHRGNEKFFCKACKFTSVHALRMNFHTKTHNNKFYKCPFCCYSNRVHCLLKYHIMNFHRKSNVKDLVHRSN